MPVVIARIAGRLADIRPAAIPLGGEHLVPDLDWSGVDVGLGTRRDKPVRDGTELLLLADDPNRHRESGERPLIGDANLARDLVGPLVDLALQCSDAGDDSEAEEKMLDVPSEPLADGRVADLGEPVGAMHVAVAAEENCQETSYLVVREFKDRIRDELVLRALAPDTVSPAKLRDWIANGLRTILLHDPTTAQIGVPNIGTDVESHPNAHCGGLHLPNESAGFVAEGEHRGASDDRTVSDQCGQKHEIVIRQLATASPPRKPAGHGDP